MLLQQTEILEVLKRPISRPLYKAWGEDSWNYLRIFVVLGIFQAIARMWGKVIMWLCGTYQLITKSKYRFRQENNIILLFSGSINKYRLKLFLFLGLSKSFDTIDQSGLLKNLQALRFRSPLQKWPVIFFSTTRVRYEIPRWSSL